MVQWVCPRRTFLFRAANDLRKWYEVVYVESEQKARANERSQKHQALLGQLLPLIDGQPEYADLTPVEGTRRYAVHRQGCRHAGRSSRVSRPVSHRFLDHCWDVEAEGL